MSNLKILTRDPVTGRLRPGLTVPPEEISGIELLVQNVALLFLNNGGRSIVVPDRVGGLRRLIGSNIDPDDPSELFTDIQLMTSQVERQIKEEQVTTRRPPSERLQTLRFIDLVPDERNTVIEAIVSVVNEEQQQQQVLVEV